MPLNPAASVFEPTRSVAVNIPLPDDPFALDVSDVSDYDESTGQYLERTRALLARVPWGLLVTP